MPEVTKEQKIKELIKKNPTLSGNKVYQLSKEKGFGIRKTDFYDLFRETKNLPEPTLQERSKAIPKKYKAKNPYAKIKVPKKVYIPKKKGNYGVVELYDKESDTSKWIKYRNRTDLDRQIDIIDESDQAEGLGRVGYSFIYHGVRTLTEFLDDQFIQFLNA